MGHRILLAVSVALLLSGCGKKAEGQTVAIVNNDEITTNELNAEIANANMGDNVDKKAATARVLQTLIDRRLLTQQAASDGLDKSPEYLNRQRRMNEDLLIGMLASRQMNTAQLPSAADVTKMQESRPQTFAKREFWNLDQLKYATPTDAGVQKRIADTKTLVELATVLGQAGIPFERGRNRLDTAIIPTPIYGRIATAGPGEPFIVPAGAQTVASAVMSREPAPLAGNEAQQAAVNLIRREANAKFMDDRLKALRQKAKIDYKTGFGPNAPAPAVPAPK